MAEEKNQPNGAEGEEAPAKARKTAARKTESGEKAPATAEKAEKAPARAKAEKAPARGEGKAEKAPARAKAEKAPARGEGKAEKAPAKAARSDASPARARASKTAPRAKAEPVVSDLTGAKAIARYVRMAPRKLRLVMDAIRGKSVVEARGILQFCGKRAAGPLAKVLNSAVANAENNHHMSTDNLYVATAFVDQGPSHKSWIPRARGRASAIHKFTSHITIVVKEREEV